MFRLVIFQNRFNVLILTDKKLFFKLIPQPAIYFLVNQLVSFFSVYFFKLPIHLLAQ